MEENGATVIEISNDNAVISNKITTKNLVEILTEIGADLNDCVIDSGTITIPIISVVERAVKMADNETTKTANFFPEVLAGNDIPQII